MTPAIRALAEFDGWIFSASGRNCIRGKNGTNRRLTDLHYDRWEWLFPVYMKICRKVSEREQLIAIQSAFNLRDLEVAGEICGRVVIQFKKEQHG